MYYHLTILLIRFLAVAVASCQLASYLRLEVGGWPWRRRGAMLAPEKEALVQNRAPKLPGGNVLAYIMLPLRFALFSLLFSLTCAPKNLNH